jgi:hypothetical protein
VRFRVVDGFPRFRLGSFEGRDVVVEVVVNKPESGAERRRRDGKVQRASDNGA